MATPYELRCRFHWGRRQVEVFIEACEGFLPPLVIKPPFPTPKDLITTALQYAVLAETKYPAQLGQKTFYKEGLLKTQYYNAKNAHEAATRPPLTPLGLAQGIGSSPTKRHTCALQGGTHHEGALRLAGIPDVIGTFSSWKTWKWSHVKDQLASPARAAFTWAPLKVATATCHQCPTPPCTHCTCGIYGGTEAQAQTYGTILGKIKQWGRFVEATQGVKSQYAYPEVFLLKADQVELIDKLKAYGVPIQIQSYITIWDPKEDGFTTTSDELSLNNDDSDDDYDRWKGV